MPNVCFERQPPREVERVAGSVAVNVTVYRLRSQRVVPWLELARACNLMQHVGAWDSPDSVQWLALTVLPADDGRELTHVEWHARDYCRA